MPRFKITKRVDLIVEIADPVGTSEEQALALESLNQISDLDDSRIVEVKLLPGNYAILQEQEALES